MKQIFTEEAKQSIASIDSYYRQLNPVAADRIVEDIQRTVKSLRDFPWIGRLVSGSSVRRSVTKRYGYIVFYRFVEAGTIMEILAIQHGRQKRLLED